MPMAWMPNPLCKANKKSQERAQSVRHPTECITRTRTQLEAMAGSLPEPSGLREGRLTANVHNQLLATTFNSEISKALLKILLSKECLQT